MNLVRILGWAMIVLSVIVFVGVTIFKVSTDGAHSMVQYAFRWEIVYGLYVASVLLYGGAALIAFDQKRKSRDTAPE